MKLETEPLIIFGKRATVTFLTYWLLSKCDKRSTFPSVHRKEVCIQSYTIKFKELSN